MVYNNQSTVFQHKTVLLHEAINALNINPDGLYLDGTFGRGGHSSLILKNLSDKGQLISCDRDTDAIKFAEQNFKDSRLKLHHCKFSTLFENLNTSDYQKKFDGILLDLGVSSPQIDNPERGFSFQANGPLDMRMDPQSDLTAAKWLNTASQEEISKVLFEYGDEKKSWPIAREILKYRAIKPIETTLELSDIIKKVVFRKDGKNPATRSFQAIRIFINREIDEIKDSLPICLNLLKPHGRLVVISFHSLEDRLVKRFINYFSGEGLITKIQKPIYASEAELAENPRARSAIMRVAEKI